MSIHELEQAMTDAARRGDWDEAERLGALVEQAAANVATPSVLDAALWYVSQGLHVFPLKPGEKIPYEGSRGCKDATLDPEQVRTWFGRAPASNIGIATGIAVDVVDVDGPIGQGHLTQVMDEEDWALVVGIVTTPRDGGMHLYLPASGAKNSASKIAPFIDERGIGGYVVAPPSVVNGKAYRWLRPYRGQRG